MANQFFSLEQCYRFLNLPVGASLEEVEETYRRQIQGMLQTGRKQELKQLQRVYQQLKTHLQDEQTPYGAPDWKMRLQQRLEAEGCTVKVDTQKGLRVMFDVTRGGKRHTLTAIAYHCIRQIAPPEVDQVTMYGMTGKRKFAWKETFNLSETQVTQEDLDLFSFDSRVNYLFAFPIAFILAIIIHHLKVLLFLLLGTRIWIHEFGHSTIAWLAGYRSLPLPIGVALTIPQRSLFVYFGILILLGLLFWSGWRENKRFPMVLAGGIAIAQFMITWLVPSHTKEMWITFGGVAGEFYLSAFLMFSFYFSLPEKWRWDFGRYLVLIIAASGFWENFHFWNNIKTGQESIPFGSLLGGQGDAGGDMNKLIFDYHWDPRVLVATYHYLGILCLLFLFGIYLYFILQKSRPLLLAWKYQLWYWVISR